MNDDGKETWILKATHRSWWSFLLSGGKQSRNLRADVRYLRRPPGEKQLTFQVKIRRIKNEKGQAIKIKAFLMIFFFILVKLCLKYGSLKVILLILFTTWTPWNVCVKELWRKGPIGGRIVPGRVTTKMARRAEFLLSTISLWKPPP